MVTRIEQARAAVAAARAVLSESEALALAPDAEVAELLAETAALSRLVAALEVRLAGQVRERSERPVEESLCRRMGARSPREALVSAFGLRGRQASDLLALAAATTTSFGISGTEVPACYPAVGAALQAGGVSLAQAQAIVQVLEPVAPRADVDDLAWAERTLVAAATDPAESLAPELLTVQGRAYAAILDPDGVLPDSERQRAMRSVTSGRRRDGMMKTQIISPPEDGSLLKALFDAYEGPRTPVRFHDPDAPEGEGADAERPVDDRTRAQRQYDVLMGIVRGHAASGDAPTAGGEAPTLVFTGTIEAYAAYLEGTRTRESFLTIQHTGEIVPMETVERLLCDAVVQRAVTDERGHVLELGREQRLFSKAQRRALAVRDRGCRAPGCRMPAAWCEAHHVRPWEDGGPTDLDYGILVCNYHHHEIHAGRLRVERAGPGRGQWRVVSLIPPVRSGRTFLADVLEAAFAEAADEHASVAAGATATRPPGGGSGSGSGSGSLAADAAPRLAIRLAEEITPRHRLPRRHRRATSAGHRTPSAAVEEALRRTVQRRRPPSPTSSRLSPRAVRADRIDHGLAPPIILRT